MIETFHRNVVLRVEYFNLEIQSSILVLELRSPHDIVLYIIPHSFGIQSDIYFNP